MRKIRMPARMSSLERARIAYEEGVQRKRQAEAGRRARDRTRNIWMAFSFTSGVVLLVGVGIHLGWFEGNAAPPSASSRDASTRKFVATRTGKVRTPIEGNTCRELEFNNESGRFVAEGVAPCETVRRAPSEAQKEAEQRFQSIREKFVK